jgi:UDPglucose 6-dehydrogenase
VVEPELDALFAANRERLRFAADAAALGACDVVYISADLATDESGRSDLAEIGALIDRVLPALKGTAVLVVLCQVPPGFTRSLKLAPERLYYQVETLVFGRAVERVLKPERFIVGCADPARPLPPAYAALLEAFACPVLAMRYESAELAKIAVNCCLAASVTVANTLAGLAERIGADWAEIAPALRLDRRIGPHAYLSPGLGLAANLERDLATALRLAIETGSEASGRCAFLGSRHRCDWALRVLHRELLDRRPDAVLGVLGLAYKENTDSTVCRPSPCSTICTRGRCACSIRSCRLPPATRGRRRTTPPTLPAPRVVIMRHGRIPPARPGGGRGPARRCAR